MKYSTKKLTLLALLAALTFVLGYFTKIPIPGGYFTLLDAGIFTTAMLLGKREGLIVGALAGFLNDFIAGYAAYMFFTLVIHGLQGYLGVVTKNKALNYVLAPRNSSVTLPPLSHLQTHVLPHSSPAPCSIKLDFTYF